MRFRAFVATLLMICFVAVLSAQDGKQAKIFGNVRDAEGNPIELVNVRVKGSVVGTATNEKGYYSLSVAKGDSVVLVFSCLGYNKAERIIPELVQDMRLNVKMNYMSVELGEAVVTTHRVQTDMMQSIDAGRMKILPDPSGGSIESLIVTYAGVSSNNELSSQYSVRGGSYDENIVYVNGVEVFRPLLIRSGQQEGLSFINSEMTETVKFSAGGFEAHYGDKMSSVLDITYKRPKEMEGSASVGVLAGKGAGISTASAYVGNSSGKFTQITGIRYKMSRSLLNTTDTKAEYTPRFVDMQTCMTYKVQPKLEVNFLGNVSLNEYKFIPDKLETTFGTLNSPRKFKVYFDGRERDRFETLFGALTLNYSQNEKISYGIQASAFNSREEESYDISGSYFMSNLLSAEESLVGNVQSLALADYHEHARNKLNAYVAHIGLFGTAKIGSANTLKFGINGQYEQIKDRISEWESRDSSGYSLPQTGTAVNVISNLYSDNELTSLRYSAYLQDIFKFRTEQGMFTLIAGLRGSYWNYNQEFLLSPRASIGFVPNTHQNLTLRLASGFYYQPPFYKELRVVGADEYGNNVITLNDQLKSQRSIHFIIGGDYTFKAAQRNFKLTTELYYKKLDDVNPYTVDNVKIRYYGDNCAKGYVMGVDMKLFGEFVPGADSWLSVSLMRSEQNIRAELKAPMPNDQLYNVSLYFQDYFPGNKRAMLNLKGVLAGGLPVTVPNRGWDSYVVAKRRTPPYRRVDIGFSYQIAGGEDALMDRPFFSNFKNIWLGVDVFNLFDISNTGSYYWITDVYSNQHAVPNYLTGRQLNLRLSVDF